MSRYKEDRCRYRINEEYREDFISLYEERYSDIKNELLKEFVEEFFFAEEREREAMNVSVLRRIGKYDYVKNEYFYRIYYNESRVGWEFPANLMDILDEIGEEIERYIWEEPG